MKRKLLVFITAIVLLFTTVISTGVVFAETDGWETSTLDFTTDNWIPAGEEMFDASISGKNGIGNWDRPYYGQEVRRDSVDGQYMYLYQKQEDITTSLFYWLTPGWKNGLNATVKIKFTLKKVGDWSKWDPAKDSSAHLKTSVYSNGWILQKDYSTELKEASNTDWFTIEKEFYVPSTCYKADSMQFVFGHGNGLGVALKVRKIEISYPTAQITPTLTETAFNFNGRTDKNLVVDVDLRDKEFITLKCDNLAVGQSKYLLEDGKLNINADCFNLLTNGTHTFTIVSAGGTVDFTVNVSNATGKVSNGSTGCGGIVAGGSAILGVILLAGATFAFKKKY